MKTADIKRVYLAVDATDVKKGLLESVRGEWNGDIDLGDGILDAQREEYEQRITEIMELHNSPADEMMARIAELMDTLNDDQEFIDAALNLSIQDYQVSTRNHSHFRNLF